MRKKVDLMKKWFEKEGEGKQMEQMEQNGSKKEQKEKEMKHTGNRRKLKGSEIKQKGNRK
jgi:hypothetical protein